MLSPEHTEQPCINMPDLDRLESLIEKSFTHDWILRVEHTDEAIPGVTSWQQWGEALFAISVAAPVMESIAACRAAYPGHNIRLLAEKPMLRTRMLYCVYRATQTLTETEVQQVIAAAPPASLGVALNTLVQAVRNRVWHVATLAGMLGASLILIEEAMA